MTDIGRIYGTLVDRVVDGDAETSSELRRAAFRDGDLDEPIRTLTEKVAHHAYEVTDDDIAAVLEAGLSEDQIFEVVVAAAIGQATRQYESGLAALAAAVEG